MTICPTCGLPLETCICKELAKTKQKIRIDTIARRFGKLVTTVSGLEPGPEMIETAKRLKAELACGGTVKNGVIELQGNHRKKVKERLIALGFSEENIIG
jgi:translation initiation factor 1